MIREPLIDFLAAGPLIKERLRAMLPPQVFVMDSIDLGGITEAQQPAPAVHVLFRGFSVVGDNAAWGSVMQRWATVVVVHNVASLPSPEGQALQAGPLMMSIINALRPWAPGIEHLEALKLDAPIPPAFKAGFAYYPIGWSVGMKVPVARPR
jgi:hypothetical protein